jgi:hypothetical protein
VEGTPHGEPLSPLPSNLALDELDKNSKHAPHLACLIAGQGFAVQSSGPERRPCRLENSGSASFPRFTGDPGIRRNMPFN